MPKSLIDVLDIYKKRIVDLSRRNRLLKYPKRARSIDFDISYDDFQKKYGDPQNLQVEFIHKDVLLLEELTSKKVTQLVLTDPDSSNNASTKLPDTPPTTQKGKRLLTTLTSLRLETRRKFEEHGLHTLFVSFGEVSWNEPQAGRGSSGMKEKEGHDYYAPLLLVPVIIEEKKNPKRTIVKFYDEVSDIMINRVLSLLIEKEYGGKKILLNNSLIDDLPELIKDVAGQLKTAFSELNIQAEFKEKIFIGQYTFYGQQIYEDLKSNETSMLENEFLNALFSHTPMNQENLSIPLGEPDDFLTVETDYNVLDADTSQLEVIERVTQGNNLNVQGPPGTGKSQTIVNIIANLIARNKTVLLVCEKHVALEVVLDRLKKTNLDKLCLPLFKYNTDKKMFAKSIIEDRSSLKKFNKNSDVNNDLNRRREMIARLKNYAKLLGANIEPLQKSLYWIHGELAKHKNLTQSHVIWSGDDPLVITFQDYRKMSEILESLEPILPFIKDNQHKHWDIVNEVYFSENSYSNVNKLLSEIALTVKKLITDKPSELSFRNIKEIKQDIQVIKKLSYLEDENKFSLVESASFEEIMNVFLQIETCTEEYIAFEDKCLKKYVIPESWKQIDANKYSFSLTQSLKFDDLESALPTLMNLIGNLEKISDILNRETHGKLLKDYPLVELFFYNDLNKISSDINIFEKWLDLHSIKDYYQEFNSLSGVFNKLQNIKSGLTRWGILVDIINKEVAFAVSQRYIYKYNWLTKYVTSYFDEQYKSDRANIMEWCNANIPQTFEQCREVARLVYEWITIDKKFKLLLKHFNDKYIRNGQILTCDNIAIIGKNLDLLIEFLSKNDSKTIPPDLVKFITGNGDGIKKDIYESLAYCENTISELQALIPTIQSAVNSPITVSIVSLQKIVSNINYLRKLNSIVRLVVKSSDTTIYTIQSLVNEVNQINNLNLILNKFKKIPLYSVFADKKTLSLYEFVDSKSDLEKTFKYLKALHKLIKQLHIAKKNESITYKDILSLISYARIKPDELTNLFTQLREHCESFDKLVSTSTPILEDWHLNKSDELVEHIKRMATDKAGFMSWVNFRYYQRQAKNLGMEWFVNKVKNLNLGENVRSLFSVTLWQAWLEKYYSNNRDLRNFKMKDHERLIKNFQDIDNISLQINSQRILSEMAGKVAHIRDENYIEETELIHQSQLKMRHKPVRRLVSEIGQYLLQYKRCWMMSPLTLSSYIPYGKLKFDTVIFDEASQMRVEHSISSIARAKQVVIFGDENQLPPTSFFEYSVSPDEDEDEEDFESVLHATKEILPGADKLLSYHYRSKYEDLITYSNYYIYNGRLTTFPNPSSSENPIEFVYVEKGVFDGGKEGSTRQNVIEAQRVAELCVSVVKEHPSKSLGVIAFSRSQESAIRDALTSLLEKHPECEGLLDENGEGLEKFFIKNLESVQGDERDVIILSVGYGKDKNGNMYQRFGPINSNYGYRRLNVAVSRAKEKIFCVSSMKASDIRTEKASRGAKLLQKYLEYAEYGRKSLDASKLTQIQNGVATDSPFEDVVEKKLQEHGFIVHRQVGASGYKIDLAIVDPKDPNRYVLGVECDGATYHSSYSARINDRIREENLRRLGWKIYRIWSQHWISHSDAVIDDIKSLLS